jgi:hypothetical protein
MTAIADPEREKTLRSAVGAEFVRIVELHNRVMDKQVRKRLTVARRWLQDADHEILGVLLQETNSPTEREALFKMAEHLLALAEMIRNDTDNRVRLGLAGGGKE